MEYHRKSPYEDEIKAVKLLLKQSTVNPCHRQVHERVSIHPTDKGRFDYPWYTIEPHTSQPGKCLGDLSATSTLLAYPLGYIRERALKPNNPPRGSLLLKSIGIICITCNNS
jgi:hypothetical protein